MRAIDAPELKIHARVSFICDNLAQTPWAQWRATAKTALFLHAAITVWRGNTQTHATAKELRSYGCWIGYDTTGNIRRKARQTTLDI